VPFLVLLPEMKRLALSAVGSSVIMVRTVCQSTTAQHRTPWASGATPRPDSQGPQIGGELWDWDEEQVQDL
jgi:hypothetical protein